MEASEFLQVVETLHGDAKQRGLFFQTCEDMDLRGRRIRLHGRDLLSFGSCSYLGLEHHPALIEGAIEATRAYGTQFASSRGYLSAPPYLELEPLLDQIFDAHVVQVQTTTLAHQAAFDTFLTEKDAIVLDHQVHFSVQRAATLARASGTKVELVRHEHLERAEELIHKLAKEHRTVWFATDGITSMYGDLAPVGLLERLLAVADNVRLYVDDAHGMSWCGEHGRGSILSRMAPHPRMVVASSLAKAYSAGGAVLVFQDREECERVRLCGGPCVFSGPLQPPLLGAAIASARLHLTDELTQMQETLAARVSHANRRMLEAGLPLLVENETPILFVRCGLPRVANEIAQRLTNDGLYVNVSMYPSVPMRRAGLRVGITATHTEEEIDRLVAAMVRHVPAVLAEEGVRLQDLDDLFAESVVRDRGGVVRSFIQAIVENADDDVVLPRTASGRAIAATPHKRRVRQEQLGLRLEHKRSIRDLDRREWDAALGGVGCISWDAMSVAERVFSSAQPLVEHRWDWDYLIVRGPDGRPVAMTALCTALQKDDMLMRERVSEAVERERVRDPYFLTSRVTMTGSALSEGQHLYVDRQGPWRGALALLLERAVGIQEERNADVLMLRELTGDDRELDDFLLEEGFVRVPTLDTHYAEVTTRDDEEMLASMPRRHRKIARAIMAEGGGHRITFHDREHPLDVDPLFLHSLYANVARRNRRMNMFELPRELVGQLLTTPAWEVGLVRIPVSECGPVSGAPVAFWGAHRHGEHYAPLFCGLDYDYVESHNVYKHCIRRVLERARSLGARKVHLGMDASLEKRRWGATPVPSFVFVQARGEYNGAVLREIVSTVGLAAA
jgi:7-keto-8-aminopelargonate synthetase-like enzyme